ncbi:MAG: tetratricopeptide repeat protein, partial [Deltaproteobacteria bacterium]|nr:tetratricopeptide repeat protein [Deltaproteobacteria bacterium]
MYKIIIEDDEGRITQVPLKWSEITIGRKDGNVIRLTERNVSRYHAKIIKDSQGISIEDLDSYNGVKINGDRIHGRSFLKDGDIVHIGDYKIILKYEQDRDDITQELPPSVQKKVEAAFQQPQGITQPQIQQQEEITPVKKAPDAQYESTAVVRMPNIQTSAVAAARELTDSNARLVLFAGHLPSKEFNLNRSVMKIGRTEENDIVLDHKSISREHAQIVFENGVFKILDMKSANGVLVNGEQYAKTELRNGDIIELGHLKLKFIDEKSPQVYQETAVVRMPQKPKEKKEEKQAFYDEFAKTEPVVIKKRPLPLIIGGVAVVIIAVAVIIFLLPKGEKQDITVKDDTYKKKIEDVQRNMLAANWGEAKNQLSVLSNQYPDNQEIQQLLSKATMEEKTKENYDKAIASLTLKNWDDAWKRFNSIPKDSYYYQLAIKEMTSLKANYIDYHLKQGMAFAREKKKNMAISEFNLVLELDPSNEIALREKARLTGEQREHEQQVAVQAKEAEPVKEIVKEEKKEAKRTEEKTAQVSQKTQKQTQKEEEIQTQQPKQKEAAKEQQVSSEPTAEDYTAEGNKLLMKNRIAEAIANYQKAIKLKPNLAAAHRSLGVAYTKIGQVDKAAKEYETYLKLQPDAPDANQVRQILD